MKQEPHAVAARRYRCFLSYRHADNQEIGRQWASWLHQSIETYAVPPDLVGKISPSGWTISERIFPVFRDEAELPADSSLEAPIRKALENSDFLVVLCSPRAVESKYVAEEIRYFKELGKSDRILAAILDGEPNASRDGAKPGKECFPEPLRFEITPAGELGKSTEPIGADFRLENGEQGWTSVEAYREILQTKGVPAGELKRLIGRFRERQELAKLKIIAGLLEVSLGDLTKRDAEYQLREANKRSRALRRWLAAVSVLTILATVSGFVAWAKQREAERSKLEANQQKEVAVENEKRAEAERDRAKLARNEAEKILNYLVYELRDQLRAVGHLGIAEGAQQRVREYYEKLEVDEGEIEQVRSRATAYVSEGDLLLQQQKVDQAALSFEQAAMLSNSLSQKYPHNRVLQSDVAVSLIRTGQLKLEKGDLTGALESFTKALEIRKRNSTDDPSSFRWQIHTCEALREIGNVYLRQGKLEEAMRELQKSLRIARELAEVYSSTPEWRSEVSSVLSPLANVYRAQGNLTGAFEAIDESVRIRRLLLEAAPEDMHSHSQLVLSLTQLGDVLNAQNKLPEARAAYEEALTLADALCARDPSNGDWRYDSASARGSLGKVYLAMEKPDLAIPLFNEVIEKNRKMLSERPNDILAVDELTDALLHLGDILRKQDQVEESFQAYTEALEYGNELVRLEAPSRLYEAKIAAAEQRIADYYKKTGQSERAMEIYLRRLERSRELVARDPTNMDEQKALRSDLTRVARGWADREEFAKAVEVYQEALASYRNVVRVFPSDPANRLHLADTLAQIGLLLGAQLDFEGGLPYLLESKEVVIELIHEQGQTEEREKALSIVNRWIDQFKKVPPLPQGR